MIVSKIIVNISFDMEISIYTDGSCLNNPGPGGWAAIIVLDNKKNKIFGGEKLTTNNRMELTAAIKALEYCDSQISKQLVLEHINVYTDSNYVKDGITLWIKDWEKNNWKTSNKKNVKNVDLWKKLKELSSSKSIEWNWIKGHSNNEMNDLADKLAKEATPI
jgi:ribonuclease HI